MADINNSYKRYQSYNNVNQQGNYKQDFMEQNYKVVNKPLEVKREIYSKKEMPKVDRAFIERSTRLGNQGQFFKK